MCDREKLSFSLPRSLRIHLLVHRNRIALSGNKNDFFVARQGKLGQEIVKQLQILFSYFDWKKYGSFK